VGKLGGIWGKSKITVHYLVQSLVVYFHIKGLPIITKDKTEEAIFSVSADTHTERQTDKQTESETENNRFLSSSKWRSMMMGK